MSARTAGTDDKSPLRLALLIFTSVPFLITAAFSAEAAPKGEL